MKPTSAIGITVCTLSVLFAGCASTGETSSARQDTGTGGSAIASRYKADDGRPIEIGKNTPSEVGLRFKELHMDSCWLANGFNFTGFDTLYIVPTKSIAKLIHKDQQPVHEWAKQTYQTEMSTYVMRKGIFQNVVTAESEIKPGAKGEHDC